MKDPIVNYVVLRKAQLKMLDILVVVDSICRENAIPYWLDAGTLLGAVRHNGFIPWDDDIDISMLRTDFVRFQELVVDKLPANLMIQNKITEPDLKNRNVPCKIRLKGTQIVEAYMLELKEKETCTGLFVDVFPVDKYSENYLLRKICRVPALLYSWKFSSYLKSNGKILSLFSRTAARIVPNRLLDYIFNLIVKCTNIIGSKNKLGFGVETSLGSLGYTKYSDLFPLIELDFEGHKFFCPNNYDAWLSTRYGCDYTELPPSDKRTWHAIKIEFDDE